MLSSPRYWRPPRSPRRRSRRRSPSPRARSRRGSRAGSGTTLLRRLARGRLGLPRQRADRQGRGARARPATGAARTGSSGSRRRALRRGRADGFVYVYDARTGGSRSTRVTTRRHVRQRRHRHAPGRVLHRLAEAVLYVYAARQPATRPSLDAHRRLRLRADGFNANGIAATPDGKTADPRPEQHRQAVHRRTRGRASRT